MKEQVKESLKVLSEDIANTVSEKTIKASISMLKSMTKTPPSDDSDDFRTDLTKYVLEKISAEFGRLVALIENSEGTSKEEASTEIKKAFHEELHTLPLSSIELNLGAFKSLLMLGCTTVGDLLKANPIDIMDVKGMGTRTINTIKLFFYQRGIDWPGNITDQQRLDRRYERLDGLSLEQLAKGIQIRQGYGSTKGSIRWVDVLTVRELREYTEARLTKTWDEELYPFEIDAFKNVKLYSKPFLGVLNQIGIITFKDLLTLTEESLNQRISDFGPPSKVYTDLDLLISNINEGLALIGRRI